MKKPYFEIYQDIDEYVDGYIDFNGNVISKDKVKGLWRWRLRTDNDRTLAESKRAYNTKSNCKRALLTLLDIVHSSKYDIDC